MKLLRSIALLLLALAAQQASAALIAYEAFDYSNVSGDLLGASGGTGFAGAWHAGGFNASINNNYDINAETLTFGSLLTTGGSVRTGAVGAIAGLTRDLANPLGLVNETVYLSFLLQPEGQLNAGIFNGFFGLNFERSSEPELFIGKPGGGALGQYVMEDRGGSGQISSGANLQLNETVLLVVKAQFAASGNDQFTLYVNPTPGAAEPLTGTVKNNIDVSNVLGLTLYSTGAMRIDELRLGNTFADVTPIASVPEPASIALWLASLGAIYCLRRRSIPMV